MKKSLLSCLSLCICLWANAQATDLVVDCQNPGWLSSKINYGDQQTVKNLKVTGYINDTDLDFIGQLIQQQNLKGHIDLSEVNIVGNKMDQNCFKINSKPVVQRMDMPKTVTEYDKCLFHFTGGDSDYLTVDTLVFDPDNLNYVRANFFDNVQFGKAIKNLILGEKVDSIPSQYDGFWEYTGIESVFFKGKPRYIGEYAFNATSLEKCNLESLDSLETLGIKAFCCPMQVDTLYQPIKVEIFPSNAFVFKADAHLFFKESLKAITKSSSGSYPDFQLNGKLNIHFKTMTPPQSSVSFNNNKYTIYVPKGAKPAYLQDYNFTDANIIEENPIIGIMLNKHEITMNIGENETLSLVITPENADDQRIAWTSEDESIVTVDESGKITAINSGQAKVYATSIATGIDDYCLVTVRKNVESIAFEETQVVLNNIGETKQLSVVVLPVDATDKSVTWKSSNETICMISATGLVTATGVGTAVITATTVDGGLTANCVVKVKQHVNSVSLDKTTLSLKVNETYALHATISPDNADDKGITWSSSDTQIVTVDNQGNVKALKAGEAFVYATSNENPEAKASCKVTVTQPVTGLTLSETSCELNGIGESIQLTATIQPEDATNKTVTWKSSNEQICVVSTTGLVTATGIGTAVVTATTVDGNLTAVCVVKVVQHVNNVTLDKSDVTLKVGETTSLNATVYPDNAENKTVNWSSSNVELAVVDGNGNVTALKEGEVWITATSVDNPEAKASCKVTIEPITGNSIVLDCNTLDLKVGDTYTLQATVLPNDAANKTISWSSSNNQIATVDSEGKVSALKTGEVWITAILVENTDVKASCKVTISQPVTGITLSQSTYELTNIGESILLEATIYPEDAGNKAVDWSSSDNSVCVVSNGLVTATGYGTAVVKATTIEGNFTATCTITVKQPSGIIGIMVDPFDPDPTYDLMGNKVLYMKKGKMYIKKGKKFIAQ